MLSLSLSLSLSLASGPQLSRVGRKLLTGTAGQTRKE